ncbi:MAG: hypothetical protein LUG18_10010 [Candidatus Azobacteroides sp.]|nr:hypothetical protein [Candidatus Azobacteroides sp.]
MKKYLFFSLFLLCFLSPVFSQISKPEQMLYKGSINGKYNITMYLAIEDPCGGNPYTIGMYKYDHEEDWIELNISFNEEENRYCMVEYLFTGVMLLHQKPAMLEGVRINPDGKNQIPVKLEKKPLTETQKEEFADILQNLFYIHNDC